MSALRAAMLVWSLGTDGPGGPTGAVEVITPAEFQGRATWRVTHHPHEPAGRAGFDLYDLDRHTLAPIRSVMRTEGLALDLEFDGGSVALRRVSGSDETSEQIPLTVAVKPEGPGLQAYVASLPLVTGYECQFHIVDRWAGSGADRVKPMTLAVTGEAELVLGTTRLEVLEVVIQPPDGSFRISEKVRKQPPHYALTTEYVRGERTRLSAVTALAIDDDGAPASAQGVQPGSRPLSPIR